jgi:hypothetical protein
VEELYHGICSGEKSLDELETQSVITEVEEIVNERKNLLNRENRTSRMWLLYLEMVKIARDLVMADRTRSWELHVNAVRRCLEVFGASGHYNYMKSTFLYLMNVEKLESTHPVVHAMFNSDQFFAGRIDKAWSGLSMDLCIEQILMRSLKTSGGLTRGSGMTERLRFTWAASAPVCSVINMAMQDVSGRRYESSDQHKEASMSRIDRDSIDVQKLYEHVLSVNPFIDTKSDQLRNVVTGVVGGESVNVDDYKAIGQSIMKNMIGHNPFTYRFRRKDAARTMGTQSLIPISR